MSKIGGNLIVNPEGSAFFRPSSLAEATEQVFLLLVRHRNPEHFDVSSLALRGRYLDHRNGFLGALGSTALLHDLADEPLDVSDCLLGTDDYVVPHQAVLPPPVCCYILLQLFLKTTDLLEEKGGQLLLLTDLLFTVVKTPSEIVNDLSQLGSHL